MLKQKRERKMAKKREKMLKNMTINKSQKKECKLIGGR